VDSSRPEACGLPGGHGRSLSHVAFPDGGAGPVRVGHDGGHGHDGVTATVAAVYAGADVAATTPAARRARLPRACCRSGATGRGHWVDVTKNPPFRSGTPVCMVPLLTCRSPPWVNGTMMGPRPSGRQGPTAFLPSRWRGRARLGGPLRASARNRTSTAGAGRTDSATGAPARRPWQGGRANRFDISRPEKTAGAAAQVLRRDPAGPSIAPGGSSAALRRRRGDSSSRRARGTNGWRSPGGRRGSINPRVETPSSLSCAKPPCVAIDEPGDIAIGRHLRVCCSGTFLIAH
jgi:hypothetical protein